MKKNYALALCAVLSTSILFSGCNKEEPKDIVLGEIEEMETDEEGSIILGGVGIFEEEVVEGDENLYSNTENPTENINNSSTDTSDKEKEPTAEENNNESAEQNNETLESTSKENNNESTKEENKPTESKKEEKKSDYETIDSVMLDEMDSEKLYNWYLLNIKTKIKEITEADREKLPQEAEMYTLFVDEQDEQTVLDYYDYMNKRLINLKAGNV